MSPSSSIPISPDPEIVTPPQEPGPVQEPKPDGRPEVWGYVFAASGAVLFSMKAIIIKLAYRETIDAETLLALRMGFALPIYAAIFMFALRERRKRGLALPPPRNFLQAIAVGMLGYSFSSYMDFKGLEYVTAQFERLILFTYPLFVVLFGAVLFGQHLSRRALLAFPIAYAGLGLIFMHGLEEGGSNIALGTFFVMASSVAFALYQLLAKRVIAELGPTLFTCVAMAAATVTAFIQFFLQHDAGQLAVGHTLFVLCVVLAIGATVLPSFLMSMALHRISAQANAVIGTLSPVATILMAMLILSEPVTLYTLAGTALVLAGVGWFTLADRKS